MKQTKTIIGSPNTGKGEVLTLFLVLLAVLSGILIPVYFHVRQTPPGTVYPLADGFFPDYYQYLSWVRAGADGNLLHINRYTYRPDPASPVHIFFPLLGWSTKPLGLTPYEALLTARLLALLLFFISFAALTKHVFTAARDRILALLLLLSQTAVWQISWQGKNPTLVEPIPWAGTFNALGKFNIPPHHLLSLAAALAILTLLLQKKFTRGSTVAVAALGVVITFLNPSISVVFLLVLAAGSIFHLLFFRSQTKDYIVRLWPFLVTAVPILIYHMWAFTNVMPWSLMYVLMRQFNPATHFTDYLLVLGPILPLALVAAANKQFVRNRVAPVLLTWAFVPVILFFLVGTTIPLDYGRLFQSYQYVPLALLGVAGIQTLASALSRWHIAKGAVTTTIALIFVGYAVFPFVATIKTQIQAISPLWYNVYIPRSAVAAFDFLNRNTPPESVVLTGEFGSQIIPAFTHNRTLIGRGDATADYNAKLSETYTFLGGKMTPALSSQFLKTYSISYILFGFDTQPFTVLPKDAFGPMTEIFRDGVVSVMRVN